MKENPTVYCDILKKEVTIEERRTRIERMTGDDILAVSKYCNDSMCGKYGQCVHTKGERYYIHGTELVRYI